jgi:nucleoside-diphosphate-sugar epimerase
MTVVVTGAFGNVGRSTVKALLEKGDAVYCLELPTKANRRLAEKPERLFSIDNRTPGIVGWRDRLRFFWGDVRNAADIERALPGAQAVIHLAALIPPAADANPGLAYDVNVGGVKALLKALDTARAQGEEPFLVFASSVAVYGDRVADPNISVGDPLKPSPGDEYASQKVICERLIAASGIPHLTLRLSYIVWRKKLDTHPIMFRMPLDTRIEICHTEDAGLAFANAVRRPDAAGEILNIGGGVACRISYRDYLDRMLSFFGLGGMRRMPESAFSTKGYHCGFLDTARAEELLGFQRKDLEDYFREVKEEARGLRAWARLFASPIVTALLRGSSYLRKGAERIGRRAPYGARASMSTP